MRRKKKRKSRIGKKFRVDKNKPIPEKIDNLKIPWDQLEIGDSFEVRVDSPLEKKRIENRVYWKNKLKKPKHFVYRTTNGVVRIWRNE